MTLMSSFSLCVFLCWACAHSERIRQDRPDSIQTNAQNTLDCENLQSRFRMRSDKLLVFFESYSSDEMGLLGRARAMMKASAVLRALRRGGDCPWVAAGSDKDLEAVGKVVRIVLANNPCAPAALAELELLVDTEVEKDFNSLAKAMSILMSDSCEIELQGQESDEINEIVDNVDDVETEELVQDGIEEMMESEDTSSSLVERSERQQGKFLAHVGKVIGAIMLGVLFMLGCGVGGYFIGTYVALYFALLLLQIRVWSGQLAYTGQSFVWALLGLYTGMAVGSVGGAVLCGAGFYRAIH